MKIWKICFITTAVAVFQTAAIIHNEGRYSNFLAPAAIAILSFVVGAIFKAFADDELHKNDPSWGTMKEAFLFLIIRKLFGRHHDDR